MRKPIFSKTFVILFFVIIASLLLVTASGVFRFQKTGFERTVNLSLLRHSFDEVLNKDLPWPSIIKHDDKTYFVEYTFDRQLEEKIKTLLMRYRSDFSSVVVIENKTGKVLAALGYERERDNFSQSLSFMPTNPAASIFKIITAASLVRDGQLKKEDHFLYHGRSTTLYRSQLLDSYLRYSKDVSLSKAFATSNNVVFGKAAIRNLSGTSIFEMAKRFGFQQNLLQELDVPESTLVLPTDQYNLAELASGYNAQTVLSPLHAALLPLTIANKGVFVYPHFVERVRDESGEELFGPTPRQLQVLTPNVASELASMMEEVVEDGTARHSFRKMSGKMKTKIIVGGKTGTITGGTPYGKRDWFVAFAKKSDADDSGISIAVMNVNVKKWYVKSSLLAKEIIESYYKDL